MERIEKGYRIKIVSWENDADNYKTKFKTVDTLEKAKKIKTICDELFASSNNDKGGVGNSMDGECNSDVIEYVKSNPELFPDIKDESNEDIMDIIYDLSYELIGSSEYYDFRVCESCEVYYIPETIEFKKIEL